MYHFVTGHRPDKLGGYSRQAERTLIEFAVEYLQDLKPGDMIITGMAQGWDQAVAWACVELKIPFVAAVPCENQESRWSWDAKIAYRQLLGFASTYALISHEYSPECMQIRNEWMVDRGDVGIAMFDGSKGGTKNCIDYAKKKGKKVVNLFPQWTLLQTPGLF